jgi:hypothetical protein
VNGIGGMQKKRRRAGRVKRGYDFLGNDGAFADTAHHHPAFALGQCDYSLFKIIVYIFLKLEDGFTFHLYGAHSGGDVGFCLQADKISGLAVTIKDGVGTNLTFSIRCSTSGSLNSRTLIKRCGPLPLFPESSPNFSKAYTGECDSDGGNDCLLY